MKIKLTIFGEPASKANTRKLAHINDGRGGKRIMFIKSAKARGYEADALKQIPAMLRHRLEVPVRVTIRIFYASERPDLDEAVVLDVMQDRFAKNKATGERELVQAGIYRNDRQVREKHVFHGIDKGNPRAEIEIEPIVPLQAELAVAEDDPFRVAA